jgi:hypothetical protein
MTNVIKILGLLVPITLAGIRGAEALEHKVQSMNSKPKSTSSFSIKNSTSPYTVGNSTAPAKQYAKNSAKPAKQASVKKSSLMDKLEFEVGAGAEQVSQSPAADYFNQLNDSFRNGDYTFSVPINDWNNIQTPNSASIGAEASIRYKINDALSAGVSAGSGQSTLTSSYNGTFNVTDIYGTAVDNFDRKEKIEINSNSIGVKGKYKLSNKFDISALAKMDNYSVSGSVDYTMKRLDQNYTQWRTADYNGTGTGTTLEAGADWNITKNVAIEISAGQKTGKIECNGTDKASDSSNPGWYLYLDYDPTFNVNSTFGKAELKIKF